MKKLFGATATILLVTCALASPLSAYSGKPANVTTHWEFVANETLRYARESERDNNPMTQGMSVRGLTRSAQKLVKSPAAKKRATNKARQLCRIVSAPGQSGVDAAARHLESSRTAFVTGVNLSAPLAKQHAWDLNRMVDIAAESYAYALCPSQKTRLSEAYERSVSPSLTEQVTDLQAFVAAYGNSVVSVTCGGITTSGVVFEVSQAPESVNAGMKSSIVTSQYALEECVEGDFLERRVTVRAGATEYPGFIWSWSDEADVAIIDTPAVLVPVRDFYGSVVPRPELGDATVLVWGQAGMAGRAHAGSVVIADSDFIFTTNRGPETHLAGAAVFNTRGDFIGIVDSASIDGTGRTITVLPITRFCGNVYSTSCYVGWASR